MNDDEAWQCHLCHHVLTQEEWASLVVKWANSPPGTPLMLHEACRQPWHVRQRLLKLSST
jgi:mRNA deadenylase 3'-5' endonuclease subunit Ccr4